MSDTLGIAYLYEMQLWAPSSFVYISMYIISLSINNNNNNNRKKKIRYVESDM